MSYTSLKPPYQTLEELSDVLFPGKPVSADDQDRLLRILDIATALLDRKCGRTFTPITATKAFDAPTSPDLALPDLAQVSSLTAWGAPLVRDQDYMLLPLNPDPALPTYQFARLFIDGDPGNWDSLDTVDPPDAGIIVTGVWGVPPPPEIVQACEMLGARLWAMRRLQYGDTGGNSVMGRDQRVSGLWTSEILELITPYILAPVPVVRGA